MLIFLVGMPGSGKTTIGQILAKKMELPFFDTDDIITNIEGRSILEIFENEGEEYFRSLEHELIQNWKISSGIVATGGGLPCHDDLIDLLTLKGKSVFLIVGKDVLLERLLLDSTRPLAMGKSKDELIKYISKTAMERKSFYQKAQIRIKSDATPEELAFKIIRKIYR